MDIVVTKFTDFTDTEYNVVCTIKTLPAPTEIDCRFDTQGFVRNGDVFSLIGGTLGKDMLLYEDDKTRAKIPLTSEQYSQLVRELHLES